MTPDPLAGAEHLEVPPHKTVLMPVKVVEDEFNLLPLDQIHKVHFIGIGGIGMSALAHILMARGIAVSGSDRSESSITRRLVSLGANVSIGHDAVHVLEPDWVVYSAAIPASNPERTAAREKKIPQMDRAALLGQIIREYQNSVSVAGSHGKTTTTALLSMLMEWGGKDPTVLIGGDLDSIGGNVKVGESDVLVTEACEYQGSFLRFPSRIGIVLNIDLDHLDYFVDLAAIQAVFVKFAQQLPKNGLLVMSATDANSALLKSEARCPVVTFGVEAPDDGHLLKSNGLSEVTVETQPVMKALDLKSESGGCWSFRVLHEGADLGRFHLGIPGRHNIHNALAAMAAALELGMEPDTLRELLPKFKGVHRRFEHHGVWNGVTIVDDYAHHPAEINATLKAARTVLNGLTGSDNPENRKIICVFQPHTYTRTYSLLRDFADALALADAVVVADIYAAREPDEGLVHSKDLAALIQARGTQAVYSPDDETSAKEAAAVAQPGDLVITMGAGPIDEVVPLLQRMLEAKD